jgi:hypothetical protein
MKKRAIELQVNDRIFVNLAKGDRTDRVVSVRIGRLTERLPVEVVYARNGTAHYKKDDLVDVPDE